MNNHNKHYRYYYNYHHHTALSHMYVCSIILNPKTRGRLLAMPACVCMYLLTLSSFLRIFISKVRRDIHIQL